MSRYLRTEGPLAIHSDIELAEAASRGLMHWCECQDEGVLTGRQFFATREEAEAAAAQNSGYDEGAGMAFTYEARSMWRDEDGDLVAAEDEEETGGEA